jgi:hypothetical protein
MAPSCATGAPAGVVKQVSREDILSLMNRNLTVGVLGSGMGPSRCRIPYGGVREVNPRTFRCRMIDLGRCRIALDKHQHNVDAV